MSGDRQDERVYQTKVVERDDGTTIESYVPPRTDEEDLFNTGIEAGENFSQFDEAPVEVCGSDVPEHLGSFQDAQLRELLMENIKRSGYQKPTPVQKHGIPCVLAGRDLMATAQTGSGKTAAFALPILHVLLEEGAEPCPGATPQTPQAVIVAPTRELAIQIVDEFRKFSHGSCLRMTVLYGGTSTAYQLSNLFKGSNVIVATPGRLLDFVEKGKIGFEKLRFLVLDEADRMLDMGFLPDIQRLVGHETMPPKGERTTLMFSATFPAGVTQCAEEFLNNFIHIKIGVVGAANADVEQRFFQVGKFGKRDKLVDILEEVGTSARVLIFVQTKRTADFLSSYLCEKGFPATSIHGDRLQRERESALSDFKSGRMPFLVATAVAARGLDIKGVGHVVNYDMPQEIDEYVHRIGRTGRVGNRGRSTSFYDEGQDSALLGPLKKILGDSGQVVPDFMLGGVGGGDGDFGAAGGGNLNGHAAEEDNWD